MGKAYDFDVAVVGGGPGGYVAAIRAAQLGAKVALVERSHLGGVCGNVGCIPTKALVHVARTMLQVEGAAPLGVVPETVHLDFSRVARHRDEVVAHLRKGVESLLDGNKVELVRAEAAFDDEHILLVKSNGKERRLSARRVFVATGSVPIGLPDIQFDGERVIDSSVAVSLDRLPKSLLIVGAGYIGCEFASAFVTFGVDVTMVEALDRVLPLMDEDCAREVFALLKKRGATIHTSTRVAELHSRKRSVKAVLSNGKEVTAEKALVCVGRRPSAEGLGLERAGVRTGENGAVTVNEHMQTSTPHIYAVGDVNGGIQLAHVASQEGLVAAAHATGTISAKMDYRVVPFCAFTVPEVATVGLTEQEAKKQVSEVTVKRFPLRALGKAHVDAATEGFVKVVADARTGELLGVHIASMDASTLIGEAALALRLEATAEEIANTIHAHPTYPESLREACDAVIGLPVNWMG